MKNQEISEKSKRGIQRFAIKDTAFQILIRSLYALGLLTLLMGLVI